MRPGKLATRKVHHLRTRRANLPGALAATMQTPSVKAVQHDRRTAADRFQRIQNSQISYCITASNQGRDSRDRLRLHLKAQHQRRNTARLHGRKLRQDLIQDVERHAPRHTGVHGNHCLDSRQHRTESLQLRRSSGPQTAGPLNQERPGQQKRNRSSLTTPRHQMRAPAHQFTKHQGQGIDALLAHDLPLLLGPTRLDGDPRTGQRLGVLVGRNRLDHAELSSETHLQGLPDFLTLSFRTLGRPRTRQVKNQRKLQALRQRAHNSITRLYRFHGHFWQVTYLRGPGNSRPRGSDPLTGGRL